MSVLFVLTGDVIETGLVQNAGEELQPNDCVDYHHEQHEEHYVGEGDHGHEDTVQHNLETCKQNAHGCEGQSGRGREAAGGQIVDLVWPFFV